jgi:preprotein translocase subunit SecD
MTGPSVTFGVHSLDGGTVPPPQLVRTLGILKLRLQTLGVLHPHVQLVGGDRVWVGLGGVANPSRAATTLAQVGRLMFFDDGATRVAGPKPTMRAALTQAESQPLLAVSQSGRHELRQLARGGRSLEFAVIKAPAGVLSGSSAPAFFVYRLEPSMTGAAIQGAHEASDDAGQPDILIDFTGSGAREFTSFTAKLAAVGAAKQSPQTFAMVLDDVMRWDPLLDYRQNPKGIPGGEAEIAGMFTVWQARSLAAVLAAGPLPVRLVQVALTSP